MSTVCRQVSRRVATVTGSWPVERPSAERPHAVTRSSRARARARPSRRAAGSATPWRRPSSAMPPLSTSTSVGRCASTSWSIDGLCPKAFSIASATDSAGSLQQLDPGRVAHGERLGDQRVDLRPQRRVGAHLAHGQPGERGERAGRGVEDDLGPLRSASVRQRVRAQAALGEQVGQRGDLGSRRRARLEGPEPRVPGCVVPDHAGRGHRTGRHDAAAHHARDRPRRPRPRCRCRSAR